MKNAHLRLQFSGILGLIELCCELDIPVNIFKSLWNEVILPLFLLIDVRDSFPCISK